MISEMNKSYEQAVSALNAAFANRYHSVAQYLLDAYPYVRPQDQDLLRRIQAIAEYDRRESERLSDLIEDLDGVPYVPPIAHEVAEWNYLALTHLAVNLADTLAKQLAQYETLLPAVADVPVARRAMNDVCEALRKQIESLR